VGGLALAAGGTGNLAAIVDTEGIEENPGGARRQKPVQIGHSTVAPHEGMALGPGDVRCSHDFAMVVNSGGFTGIVAKSAEVVERARAIKKCMDSTGSFAESYNLSAVVDRSCAARSSMGKGAEVSDLPIYP